MEVQFKYGDTWQHDYRIGDRLKWGGNDIGVPGKKRVAVEGIGGVCPFCGLDGFSCELLLADDVLIDAKTIDQPRSLSDGFIVLDDEG